MIICSVQAKLGHAFKEHPYDAQWLSIGRQDLVRLLYSFLFYIILPFVFLRVLWRSRRLPAYRQRLQERLGFYPFKLKQCIWVHAVSVGETIAALPMIKAILVRHPSITLLVTTMTPTGAMRVKEALGENVKHVYLPYDLPDAVERFLRAMNPVACIIMETELWPNMIAACSAKKIPVCLVNARLSEKSARGYRYVAPLTRRMLQQIRTIAANGQADADRFISLGAPAQSVVVTGNVKFDLLVSADIIERSLALRRDLGGDQRFIWIAASTHEGEEDIILAAHQQLLAVCSSALLVLVPRHPDRFEAMAKRCAQQFVVHRRSQRIHENAGSMDAQVYLGDTMGELVMLYGVADVAFVAGSLVPRGGHNMLEPAVLSKPILTGPHIFNFAEIGELLFNAEALLKVHDANTLFAELNRLRLHQSSRQAMGARALHVIEANRGALDRQLAIVDKMVMP